MVRKAIFDKKNVLVIGGAGFIGSHLCDALLREGNKVICVDNFISGSEENIHHLLANPDFEFVKADATQPLVLEEQPGLKQFKVEFQGIQEIYNLACPTKRKDYEKNIINTCKANSLAVCNTLEMAVKYKAKYLFTSTSAVYGDPLEGQENFPEDYWGFTFFLSPRACYNEGKRFAEVMVRDYGKFHHLDVKIARVFNTYGPRMLVGAGRMIPSFVKSAINNQDLVIYGDGQEENTFCYISDMIQGIMKLMKSSVTDPVNIGNSNKHTMLEIAKKTVELTDSKSRITFAQPLHNLTKPGIPEITRAKERLGWFPLTRLEDGLRKTIEEVRTRGHLSYGGEGLVSNNYDF